MTGQNAAGQELKPPHTLPEIQPHVPNENGIGHVFLPRVNERLRRASENRLHQGAIMKKTCVLAAAFSFGCTGVEPEFREGACEVTFGKASVDVQERDDFQALFEVGPNPSLSQGGSLKPLKLGDYEYMNPLFHDEVDPGFLGTVGTDAQELFADDWPLLSQMAFDVTFLHVQSNAEYCLTGQRSQDGIHETTYDVIYIPGYTMSGPAYNTASFVVQVDEDSGDVWVAASGEPTSID